MRALRVEHAYDVPPARLLDLLLDPAFLAARQQRFGGGGEPAVERADGAATVRVPRRLPVEHVPAAIRPLLPAGGQVVQVEEWSTDGPPLRGRWRADVGTAPAEVGGESRIETTGGGCRYVVEGSIAVRVPLLGGRLEGEMGRYLEQLIEAEMTFAAERLATG